MKQLRIDSAINLLEDWLLLQRKYINPIFICDQRTLRKIQVIHDDDHNYFWGYDFNNMTNGLLFEQPLLNDENIKGLFIMENNYK